jgi:hypothetical protein
LRHDGRRNHRSSRENLEVNQPFDWLYQYHAELGAVLLGGAIAAAGAIALSVRRRSLLLGVGLALPPFAVVGAVIAAWVLADELSVTREIDRRVHEVTAAFPDSARRTTTQTGDNFRTEAYVVSGSGAPAVASQIRRSLHTKVGSRGNVWVDPSAPSFMVAFGRRNGCDGDLEVSVNLAARVDGTTIDVLGNCED